MSRISYNGDYLAVSSSNRMLLFNEQSGVSKTFCVGKASVSASEGERSSLKSLSTGCKESEKVRRSSEGAHNLIAGCLSNDGKLLACATSNKFLYIWNIESEDLLFTKRLAKNAVRLQFTDNSSSIVVADKSGDVYKFRTSDVNNSVSLMNSSTQRQTEPEEEDKPILGHLSMLLDMLVTKDEKYVITCDRDEKIRVSSFPNSYCIKSYCLGHTQFVSQILELPHDPGILVSSSGDGSIKLWDYQKGVSIATEDISTDLLNNFSPRGDGVSVDESSTEYLFPNAVTRMTAAVTGQQNTSLLVLSINRLPCLLMYLISGTYIRHSCTISLEGYPIDFVFTSSQRRLVVLKDRTHTEKDRQPFCVYSINNESDKVSTSKLDSDIILDWGRQCYEELKDSGTPLLNISLMQKHQFDNISDYLRQKEERILSEDNSKKSNYKKLKRE